MTEQKCCEKCGRRLTGEEQKSEVSLCLTSTQKQEESEIENRCYEVDCLECWKREMKEE